MKITKLLIPQFIYIPLIKWKDNIKLNLLKKKILKYYSKNPPASSDKGKIDALTFLKKNPVYYFPYSYSLNYHPEDFEVFWDSEKQMYYVLYENHRLYLKKKYSKSDAHAYYHSIRVEQDKSSSHRYFSEEFCISKGDIVSDIGGAEGIFSLHSLLQDASKIYIFEPDKEWIEPLKATFEPWKDRVEIISKFVSDQNNEQHTSLDSFFSDKKIPDVIKMDVEGWERQVFAGAKNVFEASPEKVVVCTYHKENDDVEFPKFLTDKGYKISIPENYMLMIDDKLKAPFFRKGVVRGIKIQ